MLRRRNRPYGSSLLPLIAARTGIDAFENGGGVSLALRKLAHAVAFGVLALLRRWGLGPWRANVWAYVAAFAQTLAYAVGDEVHQRFTPSRNGVARDVGIDTMGDVGG